MENLIGKMLDDRYELLELIGTGGMANVYKAKCHRLNRLVAIKVLKSELAENADFRRRFRDESLAVAQLSHANIVSVYDVSSSEGTEYIVMELIDGITLKQYMERRGQMDWREALHFISQIMRGLNHAHSRGIIHRDIKPQNIMVLRDGSVKVADFGIACLANEGQTMTQEALGSVHYISPEQARGDRIDARSDIYSAGVVLYEMLTGRLPFEGDSAVSVAIQHLSSTPLSPREINETIPQAMELICMKAMCPDIKKRYPTAQAMLEDLEKYRKDPSVDMEYIRKEIAVSTDSEPTRPIPTTDVNAAVSQLRRQKVTPKKQEENSYEEDLPFEGKRKRLIYLGIAAAAALLVAIFISIISGFSGGRTYDVPNLTGYTVEQAQALEEVDGIFEIALGGTRADANYEPGQIIDQDPKPERPRKKGTVITVTICAEEETRNIPNILGDDYRDAKVTLQNMNFGLDIVRAEDQFSNEFNAGTVMSVDPAAGTAVTRGTVVTITVSKGPESITVISFIGMSAEQAASSAKELGLIVGTPSYEYDPMHGEGAVIAQSLEVNSSVSSGTTISFTICRKDSKSVEVTFDVPQEVQDMLANGESVKVEFLRNGEVVEKLDLKPGSTVSYIFEGTAGDNCEVSARFNGVVYDKGKKSISF